MTNNAQSIGEPTPIDQQPDTVRRRPMPLVEVVTHCWNYSRLLTYQLAGFVRYAPESCYLRVSIYHCADDAPTQKVIRYMRDVNHSSRVEFVPRESCKRSLMRRAIGRNDAATLTAADVVIFTDCDYVYRNGAIDTIAAAMLATNGPRLGYVREHAANISHADGDAEIARCIQPMLVDVDPWRYEPSRLRTAIGGSQIVLGDWARAHGYLPNSRRFQRGADRWQRTYEDKAFRAASGLELLPIDCPTVYRIRHSKRGRFDAGVKL